MKKQRTTVILVLVLIISSLIFLYPNISDQWNAMRQTRVIADYQENTTNMKDDEYMNILELAQIYNEELASLSKSRYENGEPVDEEYISQLNINDTSVMGYINIEKINVKLPIYHGTSESVLAVGTGHLEGSSLPIGGESTHTVITGHRGLATATLFTNLDQIQEGDIFTLTVLSQTLTYQVDQVLIVKPEEVSEISIVEGEDYCTLVTCTPFAINTERILVRGTRIDNIEGEHIFDLASEAVLINPMLVVPFFAIPMLLMLLLVLFMAPNKRKDKSSD